MSTTIDLGYLNRSAAIGITIRKWNKFVKAETGRVIGVEADSAQAKQYKVTKCLLAECKEYDRITTYLSRAKQWIYDRTLPFPILRKGGIRLATQDVVETTPDGRQLTSIDVVDAEIPKFNKMLQVQLIPELQDKWDEVKAENQKILEEKGQFRDEDYPSKESLLKLFGISHSFVQLSVPQNLPPEIREREIAKFEAQAAKARDEILWNTREIFQSIVERLVENLSTCGQENEKGRKTKFYESNIQNLVEFVDTFAFKNLLNDQQLSDLVGKSRELLKGVTVKGVKTDAELRESVQSKFTEVKAAVDKMLEERPSRIMSFDEES
jgi:hypothetical protein